MDLELQKQIEWLHNKLDLLYWLRTGTDIVEKVYFIQKFNRDTEPPKKDFAVPFKEAE